MAARRVIQAPYQPVDSNRILILFCEKCEKLVKVKSNGTDHDNEIKAFWSHLSPDGSGNRCFAVGESSLDVKMQRGLFLAMHPK